MPFGFAMPALGQAQVSQGKVREHEIRFKIKCALQRLFRRIILPQFLQDGGKEIMILRIQLVRNNRLPAPFGRFGKLALVGA